MSKSNKLNCDIISPKLDFMFKQCLGRPERREHLKDFLESILKIKILNINVQGQVQLKKYFKTDKIGTLDIQASTDNVIFNIEMQISKEAFCCIRTMIYWSKVFLGQGKQGKPYSNYNKAMAVWLVDFEINDNPNHISKYIIQNEYKKDNILDCFNVYVVELPKFQKIEKSFENAEHLWLLFLTAKTRSDFNKIRGRNIYIDECIEEVENMSEDEEMREIERIRQKGIDDEINMKYIATKRGMEEGRKKGMKEGMKEGIRAGMKKNITQTVERLLILKSNIGFIAQVTGVSEKEVTEIINDIKKKKVNI